MKNIDKQIKNTIFNHNCYKLLGVLWLFLMINNGFLIK